MLSRVTLAVPRAMVRPAALSLRVARRVPLLTSALPLRAMVAATPRRCISFPGLRVPADNKNLETEYEHAKGKVLQEVLYRDAGIERWGFGEIRGPAGTFENPVIIVSANPERIVGCVGQGETLHSLMWFNAQTDGPKHMCQQCGQFFQVKSSAPVDPDVAAKIAKIEEQVKAADKGITPPRPDGSELSKKD